MAQGDLGYRDEDFWIDPEDPRTELVFTLLRAKSDAIVLDAPHKVKLAERDTLPLAGIRICPLVESFSTPLRWNGVLACVRQESNEFVADTAFQIKKDARRPTPPSTIPDKLDAEQFSTEVRGAVAGFPWEPGTWLIYLILADKRSDPVAVELIEKEVKDPEVIKYLESMRKPLFPPVPFPRRIGLGHSPGAAEPPWGGPAVPAQPGIDLEVQRVVLVTDRDSAVLRGSFRLPALERDRVKPRPIPEGLKGEALDEYLAKPDPSGWCDVQDELATAVVPVHLLFIGDDEPTIDVVTLHIASTDPIDGRAEDASLTGVFEVDILAPPIGLSRIQTYVVWAFSGKHVSRPHRVALVSEEMLPRG